MVSDRFSEISINFLYLLFLANVAFLCFHPRFYLRRYDERSRARFYPCCLFFANFKAFLFSFRDLADKYPDWLADNRSKISDSEFDNYNKQFEVTKQICHEFEKAEPDSEQVMDLMQKMQNLGNPPKDLVGDAGNLPGSLDAQGNPVFPSELPEQCKLS